MRYRHQSGSGGRTFRLFLECRSATSPVPEVGPGPAVGLGRRRDEGSLHVLRDDFDRPVRVALADAALEPATARFVEIDAERLPGLYELTLPPGLFAAGSASLVAALVFPDTGTTVVGSAVIEVELVAYDPYDGVGIGLDGFTKAVRHQNLTSILVHIMPDSVRTLARQRRTR